MGTDEALEKEIQQLEAQLKDREAALPAHSIRPHQLLLIEELETAIEEKKKELDKLREKKIDPRMHSAEHILNQTMVRMFDCGRCITAHIEKKKSKCDYHFDRALGEEEIREIERRVNDIVRSDLLVTEAYVTKEEAQKKYNLDRLPVDSGDKIRIIKIGDYDACPCIGPHVDSTKDIGGFRISSTSFENGLLRIRYKLQ